MDNPDDEKLTTSTTTTTTTTAPTTTTTTTATMQARLSERKRRPVVRKPTLFYCLLTYAIVALFCVKFGLMAIYSNSAYYIAVKEMVNQAKPEHLAHDSVSELLDDTIYSNSNFDGYQIQAQNDNANNFNINTNQDESTESFVEPLNIDKDKVKQALVHEAGIKPAISGLNALGPDADEIKPTAPTESTEELKKKLDSSVTAREDGIQRSSSSNRSHKLLQLHIAKNHSLPNKENGIARNRPKRNADIKKRKNVVRDTSDQTGFSGSAIQSDTADKTESRKENAVSKSKTPKELVEEEATLSHRWRRRRDENSGRMVLEQTSFTDTCVTVAWSGLFFKPLKIKLALANIRNASSKVVTSTFTSPSNSDMTQCGLELREVYRAKLIAVGTTPGAKAEAVTLVVTSHETPSTPASPHVLSKTPYTIKVRLPAVKFQPGPLAWVEVMVRELPSPQGSPPDSFDQDSDVVPQTATSIDQDSNTNPSGPEADETPLIPHDVATSEVTDPPSINDMTSPIIPDTPPNFDKAPQLPPNCNPAHLKIDQTHNAPVASGGSLPRNLRARIVTRTGDNRKRRGSPGSNPRLVAQTDDTSTAQEFTIGDSESTLGGIPNPQLKPETDYEITLNAITEVASKSKRSSSSVTTRTLPETSDSKYPNSQKAEGPMQEETWLGTGHLSILILFWILNIAVLLLMLYFVIRLCCRQIIEENKLAMPTRQISYPWSWNYEYPSEYWLDEDTSIDDVSYESDDDEADEDEDAMQMGDATLPDYLRKIHTPERHWSPSYNLMDKRYLVGKNESLREQQGQSQGRMPLTFRQEFYNLPDGRRNKSFNNSNNDVINVRMRHWNRFPHIPFTEHTRVVLRPDSTSQNSYINANFITGYRRTATSANPATWNRSQADKMATPNTKIRDAGLRHVSSDGSRPITHREEEQFYIAAASPFDTETSLDFWRMIHQENIHNVVMLTNTVEVGVVKSAQYWPCCGRAVRTLGHFLIQTVAEKVYSNYIVRKIKYRMCGENNQPRQIIHFQYTSWPQQGVPESSFPWLELRRKVLNSNVGKNSPLLVHCGTGVSRTAVFIAMDILIGQYEVEGGVCVYDVIRRMREERSLMVRCVDQYRFIYSALQEYFEAGDTLMKLSEGIMNTRSRLDEVNPRTGRSYLEDQFDLLNHYCLDLLASDLGAMRELDGRRVDPYGRYPQNFLRPEVNFLQSYSTLNPTFVDSLRQKDAFALLSTPMSNEAIYEFWRFVSDYDIITIINLGNENEAMTEVLDHSVISGITERRNVRKSQKMRTSTIQLSENDVSFSQVNLKQKNQKTGKYSTSNDRYRKLGGMPFSSSGYVNQRKGYENHRRAFRAETVSLTEFAGVVVRVIRLSEERTLNGETTERTVRKLRLFSVPYETLVCKETRDGFVDGWGNLNDGGGDLLGRRNNQIDGVVGKDGYMSKYDEERVYDVGEHAFEKRDKIMTNQDPEIKIDQITMNHDPEIKRDQIMTNHDPEIKRNHGDDHGSVGNNYDVRTPGEEVMLTQSLGNRERFCYDNEENDDDNDDRDNETDNEEEEEEEFYVTIEDVDRTPSRERINKNKDGEHITPSDNNGNCFFPAMARNSTINVTGHSFTLRNGNIGGDSLIRDQSENQIENQTNFWALETSHRDDKSHTNIFSDKIDQMVHRSENRDNSKCPSAFVDNYDQMAHHTLDQGSNDSDTSNSFVNGDGDENENNQTVHCNLERSTNDNDMCNSYVNENGDESENYQTVHHTLRRGDFGNNDTCKSNVKENGCKNEDKQTAHHTLERCIENNDLCTRISNEKENGDDNDKGQFCKIYVDESNDERDKNGNNDDQIGNGSRFSALGGSRYSYAGTESREYLELEASPSAEHQREQIGRRSEPMSPATILTLLEAALDWQATPLREWHNTVNHADHAPIPKPRPMIIHAPRGSCAASLLCACALVCDHAQEENAVDVYHVTKELRRKSPRAVENFCQYKLIWDVLTNYVTDYQDHVQLSDRWRYRGFTDRLVKFPAIDDVSSSSNRNQTRRHCTNNKEIESLQKNAMTGSRIFASYYTHFDDVNENNTVTSATTEYCEDESDSFLYENEVFYEDNL